MQLDMHYYGTWCMARAAGMTAEEATIAATAAQFVDDHATPREIELDNGQTINAPATAHHFKQISNLIREDQWHVWVPFHFLPGNEGETVCDRLKCVRDSPTIHKVIDHHMELAGEEYGLSLIGITAHVYADTFSHYGFSGLASPGNCIICDSMKLENVEKGILPYIQRKADKFMARYKKECKKLSNEQNKRTFSWLKSFFLSWTGQRVSRGVGHGAVLTYPDRPYLEWSFQYEGDEQGLQFRNNKGTYLDGCKGLYELFRKYLDQTTGGQRPALRDFKAMVPVIKQILAVQDSKENRAGQWMAMAKNSELFGQREIIPRYDNAGWSAEKPPPQAMGFYRGAEIHRRFVLRDLLPEMGLCNMCEGSGCFL